MILFLDFDGVLHPDAVYLRLNGEIELRADGQGKSGLDLPGVGARH